MFVGILLRDFARDFGIEFESSRHREIFEISSRTVKKLQGASLTAGYGDEISCFFFSFFFNRITYYHVRCPFAQKEKIKKTSFIKISPLFVRHYSKLVPVEPAIFTAAATLVTSYT